MPFAERMQDAPMAARTRATMENAGSHENASREMFNR